MSLHSAAVYQHLLRFSLSFIMRPTQAGQEESVRKLCMPVSVGHPSHAGRAVPPLFVLLETMGDSYESHCISYLIFNPSCWFGRAAAFISSRDI